MSETVQIKNPSPLVKAVLALDTHFSNLLRLGERIESLEMKSNFDYEQAQGHLEHFAKAGQGVSEEVVVLAQALAEVRARAEAVAAAVAERAERVNERQGLVQAKMREFMELGEQVRELNFSLQESRQPEGAILTDEDRERYRAQLARFDERVRPLIEKAEALRKEGQDSRIRELEQGADSLGQKLKAVSQKLSSLV